MSVVSKKFALPYQINRFQSKWALNAAHSQRIFSISWIVKKTPKFPL